MSRYHLHLFLLAIMLAACGTEKITEDDQESLSSSPSQQDRENTEDSEAEDDATLRAEFNAIQTQIFSESCAFSSCHGSAKAGNLTLDEGNAYAALINVEPRNSAAKKAGYKLVSPGDPANSFLWLKLQTPAADEGALMPKGGAALSDEAQATIEQWILNGAKEKE